MTSEQGSTTSVAASVLNFPPETVYLQPYHLPIESKSVPPFPLFEMLGPYAGYVDTKPRLPVGDSEVTKACESLFSVCEALTDCYFESVPADAKK